MNTHSSLIATLLLLPLLSACIDASPRANADDALPPVAAPRIGALVPEGPMALATPAGHRINEYWIARDPSRPQRIAMASMDGDDPAGGSICTVTLTDDEGKTWREITPPKFHTEYGQADPWVTIGPDGAIHAACMEWGGNRTNGATWMLYSRSVDGGATWTDPVVPPNSGFDREIIGSDSKGTLYWCATARGLSLLVSRDGGQNWQAANITNGPGYPGAGCHDILETPDGDVFVVVGFNFWHTADNGDTWDLIKTGLWSRSHYAEHPACKPFGGSGLYCWVAIALLPTHPFPIWQAAANPVTGALYIAYQNLTNDKRPDGSSTYRVELYRSTDKGQTWARLPVPAAADRCVGCNSARPVITVDPQGRVGMLWRQAEVATHWQTWFSATPDDGTTWATPIKLSETDAREGPWTTNNLLFRPESVYNPVLAWSKRPDLSEAGQAQLTGGGTEPTWGSRYEGGHYQAMTWSAEGFLPCWVDMHGGGAPQVWCQRIRAD